MPEPIIFTDEHSSLEFTRRMLVALADNRPVYMLVPWDDSDETPLDAIGRLNQEVLCLTKPGG